MNKNLIFVLILIGAVSLFLANSYERFPWDLQTTLLLQGIESPLFGSYMELVSFVTIGLFMFIFGILVVLTKFILRKKREFFMSLGMLVALSTSPVLKLVAGRPRPSPDVVQVLHDSSGFGYPSGHALQAMVLFGFLIYLAEHLVKTVWIRRMIQVLSLVMIVSVGMSRIYLGAHWLSDVIAGYYFGGLSLLILITFWDKIQRFIDRKIKLKYFDLKEIDRRI